MKLPRSHGSKDPGTSTDSVQVLKQPVAASREVAGNSFAELAIIAAVAIATTLAPLNSTMIAVALPTIEQEFGVEYSTAGWLVIAYLIAMAALQPMAGNLGDRFGRRTMVLGGLVGFALASAGAFLAVSFPMLLICRLGQAVAGAIALPNSAALIYEIVPAERRAGRFGMIGAVASFAAAAGPPLGGLLVSAFGWRAIFSANLPIVIVSLALGWWVIPRSIRHAAQRRFDFVGSALLIVLLGVTAFILTERTQIIEPAVLIVAAIALICLAVFFVRYELRQPDPVLPPRLFKVPAFAAANAGVGFSNLAMYVTLLTVPLLLTRRAGWDSFHIGLLLSALSAATVIFAPLGGRLADRLGRRKPVMLGMLILTLGTLPFALTAGDLGVPLFIGCLFTAGAGLGLASAGLQSAALEAADSKKAGVASGVSSTSRYLGSIVGSSVLASLTASPEGAPRFDLIFVMVVVAAAIALLVSFGLHDWPKTMMAKRKG